MIAVDRRVRNCLADREMDVSPWRKILMGIAFVMAVAIPAHLWVEGGWLHSELIPVSESVWSPSRNASWHRQLATSLVDWRLFESTSHRLRPLSDFVEVVDAMTRPLRVFGTHPSLGLSAVLLAALTAVAFYRGLRLSGRTGLEAAFYTLLLVTTIGYLSCFVPYIRPAKKLALLCCALMIYFCCGYRARRRGLVPLWLSLFLAFFADEAGFVFWPIACLLLGPILVAERRWKSLGALVALPAVYFGTVKLGVPAMYALIGVPRVMRMDVMGSLLGDLLFGKFYLVAACDYATALMATLGVVGAPHWVGDLALVAWLGLAASAAKRRQWWQLAALGAPVLASFGLTLFDWYNTPFASNGFGALTYYYHSPVAPLIVFALSQFAWPPKVVVPVVLLVVGLNFTAFSNVNRLAMIMHTYPLEARSLPREVETPGLLVAEFNSRVARLNSRERSWFQNVFAAYEAHPMGGSGYARRYWHLFYPRATDPAPPSTMASRAASAGLLVVAAIDGRNPSDHFGQSSRELRNSDLRFP